MRRLFLLNAVALAAVLTVNYLSNALPLHGKTPAQLSDQYPNLFVPAGLTFSIWGVIYTWLLVWVAYQVVAIFNERIRTRIEPGVLKAGGWFALTSALNIAWLFAWHWEQIPLSVAIMVALLAALWRLNRQVGTGLSATNNLEKWLAHAPFGLYQGWITIALIANVTALLVSRGWHGFGISETGWAVGMVIAGTLLANTIVRTYNNVFHGLAVAWALLGIYLKNRGMADPAVFPVGTVALAGCVLIVVWGIIRWRRWLTY